ncbi:hypothetical protein KC851_04300 [Candidatus Kaiserbacteria bacterium]|nr:hypothetical protein [Candidatus Kaiserbacteria bacterium]
MSDFNMWCIIKNIFSLKDPIEQFDHRRDNFVREMESVKIDSNKPTPDYSVSKSV